MSVVLYAISCEFLFTCKLIINKLFSFREIYVGAFLSTSFAASDLKKWSSSCVCSHLSKNSVYTVDIATTRSYLRTCLFSVMFFVNTHMDVFLYRTETQTTRVVVTIRDNVHIIVKCRVSRARQIIAEVERGIVFQGDPRQTKVIFSTLPD